MKKYKLYLLDMDGTLYLGNDLFDCTKPFLSFVKESGGSYVFVTNNSSKSVRDYAAKLRKLGIETDESEFFTSSQASVVYLNENYPNKLVYALGTESFKEELRAGGVRITDKLEDGIDVLIMGYDTELNYQKLTDACILLDRGVDYVATNPDLVCPTETGFLPDCGSFAIMLKNATGREPYYIGKPQPAMVELCLKARGLKQDEAIIVGDRIYTDIASGINAGIDAALVMSGETTYEILEASTVKPTFVLKDVSELIV